MQQNESENQALRGESPAFFECLSDLGRRATFPRDIPFQAAQAKTKGFNATIGQITDGAGSLLGLPTIEGRLDLADEERNRALLYSPIEGHEELRQLWRGWQRRGQPAVPSTVPLVTVGLTHGLSQIADLFGGPGRKVAIPSPFWGNYRQIFAARTGAEVVTAPTYVDGRFNPHAIAQALADLPAGEPAVAILNVPSNPGGYSPTLEERTALIESLVGVAEHRPLLVVCDDAYAGLVYEEGVPTESLFWAIGQAHPNLAAVKVDGATKEFGLFGGRVGFLTFALTPDGGGAAALESKVKSLSRATVGSPVSIGQVLLREALENETIGDEIEIVRKELENRCRILGASLDRVDSSLVRPMPFNSGCFALIEIPAELGIDSETARLHLLESHDTGLIGIRPNYLRIAFCSVRGEDLPELVQRIEAGLGELAAPEARSTADP